MKKIHITFRLDLIILLSVLLIISLFLVFKYKIEVKQFVAEKKRSILIEFYGKNAYVGEKLKSQYALAHNQKDEDQLIETSRLPLRLHFIDLAKFQNFPTVGGALLLLGNNLIVLDRLGAFYLYENKKLLKLQAPPIPSKLSDYISKSKEMDLSGDTFRVHSVAYDKDRKELFVSYTQFVNENFNRFTVSSISVDPNSLLFKGEWKRIYESPLISADYHSQAGAGKIYIVRDKLFIAVGYAAEQMQDGHLLVNWSDVHSPFGKIIEIDLASRVAKIISVGHRNIQGMSSDLSGHLFAVEHGPQGGDEVNLIEQGGNYGWPVRTFGTDYGSYNWHNDSIMPSQSFKLPFYAFVPSIGVSSIQFLNNFDAQWNNDFLVGSLKAQSLFRLKVLDNRVVYSEPVWVGHRVRDILQWQGNIALLADDATLILVSVDKIVQKENQKNSGYNFNSKVNRCLMCHHFEQTTPSSMAPSLANICNRNIASDTFGKYSESLKKHKGKWTPDNLKKFILNPLKFSPGSTMPNLDISEAEVDGIVDSICN